MIPGAYAFTFPQDQDAKTMLSDGILQPYLEAVLADANSTVEVGQWTL